MSEVNLPASISTPAELETTITGLRSALEHLESATSSDNFSSTAVSLFFESTPKANELSAVIDQLENILEKAPTVQITLSGYPEDDFKQRLVTWFRNIQSNYLIDIIVRPSIIGGLIVRDNRRVYDLSFKSSLENQPLKKEVIFNNGR